MVIRIVRMHLSEETADDFLDIFNRTKEAIRHADGCLHLELLRDTKDAWTFTTLSHWADAGSLENYRKSELFKSVWARVKPLFQGPSEAYSMEKLMEV